MSTIEFALYSLYGATGAFVLSAWYWIEWQTVKAFHRMHVTIIGKEPTCPSCSYRPHCRWRGEGRCKLTKFP